MAIPKTKKPIAERKSRLDIEKAMKSAALMETPGVSPEEGSAKNSVHKQPDTEKAVSEKKAEQKMPSPSPTPKSPSSSSTQVEAKPKATVGRPPLKPGRTERITVWFTPEIKKRLKRALLQEKLRRDENDQDIDQSLLVEEALENWLKTHKY
jgi:hypothetical protein